MGHYRAPAIAVSVFPSGRRSFVINYRLPGGRRTFQMALGPYGVLTLAKARALASTELAKVRMGGEEHPLAAPAQPQAAETGLGVRRSPWRHWSNNTSPPCAPAPRRPGVCAAHGPRKATWTTPRNTSAALPPPMAHRALTSLTRGDLVQLLERLRQAAGDAPARMHGAIKRMYHLGAAPRSIHRQSRRAHRDHHGGGPRALMLSLAELVRDLACRRRRWSRSIAPPCIC